MRYSRWFLSAAIAAMIVLLLSTCDLFSVGLGSKVDLNPPTVKITEPVDNSYVAGVVTLKGTVEDDIGVQSVRITIEIDGVVFRSVDAKIDGTTWTAELDTSTSTDGSASSRALDGSRVISATATDKSGKSLTDRVNVNFDTSAPTVLISVPQAAETDKYNTKVIFRGTVYDPSPLNKVEVVIFGADGTEKYRESSKNTASWTVTVDSSDIVLPNGTYSYAVYASDRAGNTNGYTYHSEDMTALFGSTVSEEDIGPMDQGEADAVLPGGITAAQLTASRRYPPNADDAHSARALFEIDMNTDKPTFSVSVPSDSLSAAENVVGSGASVIGVVEDDKGLDMNTLVATITPTPLSSGTPISIDVSLQGTQGNLAYSINFPLKTGGLASGAAIIDGAYELVLSVKDLNGLEASTNPIGFTIDGSVPIISDVKPDNGYIAENTDVTISVNVSDDNGVSEVRIGLDEGVMQGATRSSGSATSGTWIANVNVPFGSGSSTSVRIEAEDSTGKTSRVLVTYNIDSSPPTIEIISPDLSVSQNGIIQLKGATRDNTNSLESVSLTVNGTPYSVTELFAWTVNVDTSAFIDGTTVPIQVVAKDNAGNTTTVERDLIIYQDSDVPVLTLYNLDSTATSEALGISRNQVGAGAIIRGAIADDDGIVAAAMSATIDGTTATITVGGTPKLRTFEITVPSTLSEGPHALAILASDDFSLKLDAAAAMISRTVWFCVDENTPVLQIDTPGQDSYFNDYDYTISGSAQDTWGVASVRVSFDIGATWLDATLANPGAASSTWTLTIPNDSEGLKNIKVQARDSAGKSVDQNRLYTIHRSAPVVAIATPAVGSWQSGSTFAASGSVSENAGGGASIGIARVEWSLNGSDWTVASGTNNWNATTIPISALAEGPSHTLYLRAYDIAGNVGTTQQIFGIDRSPPNVTVDGSLNRDVNSGFSLSGTASDGYAVANVTVTQNGTVISTNGPSTSDVWATWTLANLPRQIGNIGAVQSTILDGTYVYEIQVIDFANKSPSLPKTVTVRVDSTPPNLNTITAPAAGQTGVSALNETTFTFQGNASDAGVGLAKIWYAIDKNVSSSAIVTTPGASGYAEIVTSAPSDTPFNWNFLKAIPGDLAEGVGYYLHVLAEDSSGNRTPTVSAASIRFDIDRANPVLSETLVNTSSLVTVKTATSLGGQASDTNLLTGVSLSWSKDEGTLTTVPLTLTAGAWSWTLPVNAVTHANDGTYDITITATDIATKTTSLTRRVRVDTTGPSVTVTNPASDSWSISANVGVSGVASDLTGVRALYYSMAGTEPALPVDPSTDGNWTANGWTKATGTASWSIALSALSEGAKTIRMRGVDSVNNISDPVTRSFGVDLNNPELTASTPAANLNAGFTLTGTSSDTNALAATAIRVTQKKGSGTAIGITVNPPTTANGWASWTLANLPRDPASIGTQLVTAVADGEYEYVVTVTDVAGKTKSVTRNVRFDKTVPTATVGTLPAPLADIGTSFTFRGSAADSGSGVKAVRVSFSSDGSSPIVASLSSEWSATVEDLAAKLGAQGNKTIYVQAEDNAGNLGSWTTTSASFVYDTAAPIVGVDGLLNRDVNTGFSLSGTASDGWAVANVTVTQNGNLIPTNGPSTSNGWATWTLANLPRQSGNLGAIQSPILDGTFVYVIQATDSASKASLTKTVTVRVDSTPPNVNTISAPAAGQTGVNALNGTTFKFMGSAGDAGVGLAKIWYVINKIATAPAIVTTPAAAGYTELATGGNWNFTKAIPGDLAEGVGYYLHVLAEDSSGNRTPTAVSTMFDIDQAAPSLDSAAPSTQYATSSMTIAGTASDTNGLSGVTATRYNGTTTVAQTVVGSGSWSIAVDPAVIGEGVFTYTITATDVAGRTSTIEKIVTVDTTAPTVSVSNVSPLVGSNTVNGTISFTASAIDANGLTGVKWSILPATDADPTYASAANTFAAPPYTSSIVTTTLSDNTSYKLWIAATDKAGNEAVASFAVLVNQASDKPSFALTNMSVAFDTLAEAAGNLQETGAKVTGTITDDDGVNGTTLKISIDGVVAVAVSTKTATGSGYSFEHNLSSLAEGVHYLTLTASDINAMVAVPVTVYFTVDKFLPNVGVNSPAVASSQNATFPMEGYANDTNGLATWDDPATPATTLVPYVEVDTGLGFEKLTVSGGTWTLPITLPGTGALDGSKTIHVKATDRFQKTNDISFSYTVDETAPDPSITLPAPGAWYRGTTLNASGNVVEANGLTALEWVLDAGTSWTPITVSTSWTANVPISGETEGMHNLKIRATDRAGNVTIESYPFGIDQADPTTSVTAPSGAVAAFTISGTALDGNAVSSIVVTQIKDGVPASQVEAYRLESIELEADPNDYDWTTGNILPIGGVSTGTYTYTVTVTDFGGHSRTYANAATVAIDLTPPDTAITDPSTNPASLFGNSYEIRGTASDTGPSGLARVDYRVWNNQTTAWSSWATATGTASWSKLFTLTGGSGLGEGSFILEARAYDGAGNVDLSSATLDFYIDQSLPTISAVDGVGSFSTINGSRYTATSFGLSMTAADTNALASYTLRQKRGASGEWKDIATDVVLSGTSQTWTVSSLPRNPASPTVAVADLTDGLYTYSLTVKDAATRVSDTYTWTVTFDAANPSVSILTPGDNEIVATATITATGTATDGEGSGVSSVYYTLGSGDPDTLLSGTTNWNGSVALGAEGAKALKVWAMDFYGNYSAVDTVSFNLDLTPPTLTETAVGAGTQRRSGDFSLYGVAYDTNGLKTWDHDGVGTTAEVEYITVNVDTVTTNVRVYANGEPGDPDALDGLAFWIFPYTVPVDGAKDGDHTFTITATDVVNKPTTITRLVTVDSTKPTIAIDGLMSGFISGSATAGTFVVGRGYVITTVGDTVWTDAGAISGTVGEAFTATSAGSGTGTASYNLVNGSIGLRFSGNDNGVGIEKSGANYLAYYTVVANGTTPVQNATAIAGWTTITSTSSNFNISYNTLAASLGLAGAEEMDIWIGIRDAVNVAPNFHAVKFDLSVDQTSDTPAITVDNLNALAVTNSENSLGQSPSILVTIADDDLVDAASLRYRIDANNDGVYGATVDLWNGLANGLPDGNTDDKWENENTWYDFGTGLTSSKLVQSAKILLENFPQGMFGIQIEAKDSMGTAYSTATITNVKFAVDYGPPAITVSAPLSGIYTGSNIAYDITAVDALGVEEIKYSFDNGATYTTLFSGPAATTVNQTGNIDISARSSGEYTLQVVATDIGGFAATQQIPITIDKAPPTIDILTPAAGVTLNGANYEVRGEAFDNRLVGAVFLWHGLVTAGDPALPARTAPDTYNPGGYTMLAGKSVWNTTINTTAQILTAADGYRIRVVAVDAIGNVGTPEEILVKVDQEEDRPVISFSNLTVGDPTNRLGSGGRIVGLAEDDDSVRLADIDSATLGNQPGLQIILDTDQDGLLTDETWQYVSNVQSSNAPFVSWYHDVSALPQGLMKAKVRAIDTQVPTAFSVTDFDVTELVDNRLGSGTLTASYNWTESPVLSFYIDFGPPTLTNVLPTSSSRFNLNSVTVSGGASDALGLKKVSIWVDKDNDNLIDSAGGEWTDSGVIGTLGFVDAGEWTDTNSDGWVDANELYTKLGGTNETFDLQTGSASYLFSHAITSLTDGTKLIQVKAYDLGYAETVRDLSVTIDTTLPSSTIAFPVATATINAGSFVIGTAYVIVSSGNTAFDSIGAIAGFVPGTVFMATGAGSGTGTASALPVMNGSFNYMGTADDTGGIVSSVEYVVVPYISAASLVDTGAEAWNLLAGQTNNWSVSLNTTGWTDKANFILKVRSKDWANNYSLTTNRIIRVDQSTDRPRIQVTSIIEGGTAVQNLLPGDKVITGTIQDDDFVKGSSIQRRIYAADGTTLLDDWANVTTQPADGTFVVWSTVIGRTDGTYQIRLRAYDTVTLAYTGFGYDDRFSENLTDNGGVPDGDEDNGVLFAIDTANPVIEVTEPVQNYFSNTDVPFSGTASDGSGIKTLTVGYRLQGNVNYTLLAVTGTETWSASLNVAALADGVYDWRVTATDNFDKSSIIDRIFTLDRTKPEITISNPGVDAIVNGSLYMDGSATDKWKGIDLNLDGDYLDTDESVADGFQITSVRVWMGKWTVGETVEPVPPALTSFYTKADTDNLIHDAANWKELNGTNSWNYRINTTVPIISGIHSIFVAAFDNSGNVSAITKRRIYIDQATNLPSISLTTLLPGYDSGTIAALPLATTTTFSDAALSDSSVVAGWYVRFRNTGIIRKVTAFSGSQITFSPKLTTAPSGGFDLFPNLLGLPSSAEGEVSDDDGVNSTSIKIAVDANGDGVFSGVDEAFINVDSKTVSGGKVIFSHNIGGRYDQGLSVYRLKVQASDTGEPYGVDPVTQTTNEYVFVRDDSAPESATLSSFGNGVEIRNDGIVGSNFRNYLHLEGVAKDSVGVANVEVAIGTAANFTLPAVPWDFAEAVVTSRDTIEATWSFTNANVGAKEGPIVVRVRVTDMVGRQTTEPFTFNVDKTGPVSVFESPAAASLANGSMYISGSAQDTYRISQVYLWIEDSANPTPDLPDATTANGWILATDTSAWNHRFDTTDLINGAKTVHVVSIDNAGNVGAVQTLAVTFDQGINRPILTVPSLGSSSAIGTMGASEKTNFTDTALIGNLDVKIGWVITFPDGTEKTVSAFDSGTGLVSWTGELASAFPVGSSYTLAAPWYTITTRLDDDLTVSALSNANRGSTPAPVAGSVALIEVSAGVNVTYLVSAFDGATGTLTLVSVPAGVTNGSTRVKVLPKTLLGLGASLSGTVTDDDGVNTGTIQISIDLNNDGDYVDTVGGLTEAYQNVASVSGAGNAVSFSQSLATLLQGTTVYKIRLKASDKGESIIVIPAVTETSEYLVAKDDAVPNDSGLLSFSNGFYGASLAVPAKVTDITGSYIANGMAITLTGTASDTVGVAAVDISVNGGTSWLPASGTSPWTWTHTFAGLVDGANVPVSVRTTDYWGRTATTQFTFKADSALPSATFPAFGRKLNGLETLQGTSNDLNSGIHAVYFNKTIADTNADGTPDTFTAFSLTDPTANGWTVAGVTGTTSWNTSVDTIATSNTAIDKNVRIAVTAVDEAGNFYSFERVETINQDSDRPVISFSNIGMTSTASVNRFDANPKIIGAATDDDGVDMAKVLVSLDGSAYVLVTNPPTANGSAGTTVTWSHELTDLTSTVPAGATATAFTDAALANQRQIVAGSWQLVFTIAGSTVLRDVATFNSGTGALTYASTGTAPSNPDSYTLRLKEGLHTVSVRVGDLGSASDSIRTNSYRWEQSDGNAAASWQDDPTDFTYDTGAPVIALTRLQMVDRYAGAYLPLTPKTWDLTDENLMSAVVLDNDWTLTGTALDGSLASVTVQVDSGTVSGNIAIGSTWTYDLNWLSSPPVGFLQGSHTVKITATDSFGKSTVKTLPVIFDSAEPVSTLSSPASTAWVFNSSVNGIVYMNGSLGEASSVTLDVGLAGRPSYYATYTTPTAVANWTYNFNSGSLLTDPVASPFKRTFAMISGDTDDDGVKDALETWTGDNGDGGGIANNGIEDGTEIFAYISNIRITATDTAGNVTRQTYTFTIDNSTDRPTASFTLPADGSYRSGDVLVSGLSSDDNQADDGVYNVWVQLDVNGDGLFTGNWEFPGGATAGAGNDPYENEALWYKVPDAQLINGAAWSLSINGNGTLYSAATPVKTPSLTAVTIAAGQLYASATGFSGMIKMRAVAVDNHGTVGVPTTPRTIFLDESYPSVAGIFINGTAHTPGVATLVNAIVKLSTLFSDDQTLGASRLEVKYNTAAFAAIAANALAGPYDWNGDGINEVHALKKAGSTAIGGTSSSTLATSLTATALDGVAFVPGMVLHTGSGSRVITGFVDGVGSGTVSWAGDLVLSATEPFVVVEPFELDTSSATAIGGTVYQDSEGVLNVTFRVTDETNQASQTTVELAVDNKRPSGVFNHNDSLTYIGADKVTGLYSFSGNTGVANLLVGSVSDTGTISGVRQVGVYFVEDVNGDDLYDAGDKFWSPRLNQTSTLIGSTVSMYATGSGSASSVPYPSDSAYIIQVDKRTENLVYDADPDNDFGDDDGFQESLLTKAGYDEWKVYFDTTRLPDGPMWIFAIYEDDAGNRSYQRIEAQISNNPPSIGSVVVGSSTINSSNDRAKVSGTVGFTINASDAEGVKVANFKLSVTKKYLVGSGGIIGTEQAFTPFYYGDQAIYGATGFKAAFTTLTPATGSATTTSALVNIDTNTADFPSGYWYKFQAQAVDTDGNTITRDFFIWVNNTDDSAPIITFANPAQTAIATATGHLDAWTESLNDGASSVNAGSLNADVWYTILSLGTTDFTVVGAASNTVGVSFKATGAGNGTGTATIADTDLSGLVTLSGTVYDDTSIASVTLQISYNAGVDWTDLPNPITSFGTPISGDAINGYTYNWSYSLNTADAALVTGSAGLNLVLRAKAQDGKPNSGYAVKPVDVVPYITDITTGLDSGSAVYIKRSALGRYPIASGGANFTIKGFNFGPSSTVTIGNVAVTVASRIGTTSLTITNNLTTSGAVVVTTNTSVLSLNNSNNNTLPQNKEAKTFNPNLTDDRYISVWQLTSNSTIPNVTEATMRPGIPRDGKFNWMYVKNGAELRYYRKGTPNTEYWITKGQALSGGDFVYNSSGTMTFLFNNNEQWTSIDDSWNFTGSMQWGALPLTGTLGLTASSAAFPANAEAYNWNLSATGNFPRLGLGNTSFVNASAEGATTGPAWYTYGTKAINRYSNAKLRVIGTNATNYNYAAYFDSATESRSIVFYAFSSGTAPVASARNVYRGTTAAATTIAIGGDGTTAWRANLDKFNGDLTGTVAFAGTQKNNNMGIYTPRGRWNMTTGSADSAHFDLQVFDTGTAHYGYLAYYDSSGSGALKIIANTNLKVADPIPATGTTTPTAMGSWTSPVVVDTGAGAYVSMVIDPAGGIHLAYQDGASGYLKYAYLTFNGTSFSTPAPVTVDALLSSGQYNSITIRNFSSSGTDYRPVITTYSSVFSGSATALRMVYPVNALSAGSFGPGADPETGTFIGNWESIAVRAFTSPLTANTFIDTTATTPGGYGKPHIGYNGSYPEEAELLDLNL